MAAKDMDRATEAKAHVEEAQRELRRRREELGEEYTCKYFTYSSGKWMPKLVDLPGDPESADKKLRHFIWPSDMPSP